MVWFGITQGPNWEERDCHVWGLPDPVEMGFLCSFRPREMDKHTNNGQTHPMG